MSPETIAEGTALVEQLLATWASKTAALEAGAPAMDGEDVTMVDRDVEDLVTKEYAMLKECYDEFKPKLEAAEWTRTVLCQTY